MYRKKLLLCSSCIKISIAIPPPPPKSALIFYAAWLTYRTVRCAAQRCPSFNKFQVLNASYLRKLNKVGMCVNEIHSFICLWKNKKIEKYVLNFSFESVKACDPEQ